jgi:AraC family cel operon transcriptional repressor
MATLRYSAEAGASPYHAALVPLSEPRGPIKLHGHADFHELVYVTAGHGWHQLRAERHPLEAGMLVLVRPGDVHGFAAAATEQLHFINVAFPSRRWRAFVDFVGVTAGAAWDRAQRPVVASSAYVVQDAVVRALSAYQDSPTMLDLVALWTAVTPLLQAAGAVTDTRPEWLTRACAAMEIERNLQVGLPRMLELAAVSPGHLARCMREHYGCTPVQFVAQTRLAHAATALATTTDAVGRIAPRFGFTSQSYFGRCFAARYGLAPRQFRDRARRAMVPN